MDLAVLSIFAQTVKICRPIYIYMCVCMSVCKCVKLRA